MEQNKRREKGFTLIELMVVMTIIAILAALIGTAVIGTTSRAEKAKTTSLIQMLSSALDNYHNDFLAYPPIQSGLGEGDCSETLNGSMSLAYYLCNQHRSLSKQLFGPYLEPNDIKKGGDLIINASTGEEGVLLTGDLASTIRDKTVFLIYDVYGNEIIYRLGGRNWYGDDTEWLDTTGTYDLISRGPDGIEYTLGSSEEPDDITNYK